jgi:hypothetical protein
VEEHTQCKPRRNGTERSKELTEFKRLDSNKNTPDLRTLVNKTPELAEETSPRGKTWHNLDQGTPNGEERRVVVRLIKTAHEIHYR